MRILLTFLLGISLSWIASAAPFSFLPEDAPQSSAVVPGKTTEEEFNFVIKGISEIYETEIIKRGGILEVQKDWKNGKLNAEAEQIGNRWVLRLYGGFARYRNMNKDTFALVACHEMGHHLAGAPKFQKGMTWGSVEGQSDYFATAKCMRRLWEKDDNEKEIQGQSIPESLKTICYENWPSSLERFLCLRSGLASLEIGKLLAFLKRRASPKVETPDLRAVAETNQGHSKAQCRLDSFIQGSLCSVSAYEDFSDNSAIPGSCHPSLGHQIGTRPACWYKSAE